MKTTPRIVLCSSILMAGISGCVIPIGGAEVGDVRVTWSFDGSQRCTEVGVDNVTVQLIEKGKEGAGGLAFGQTGACIEGSMVLPDVVAGNYTMTVVGDGDVAVFSNGKGIDVEVKPNQETPIDAALSLANGEVVSKIEFQFLFPGALNCSAAGVATITAQVIDENGIGIAGSTTDCVGGLAVVEGIRLGDHTLKVEAIDGDGNVRFAAVRALTGLQAGETLRIDPISLAAELVNAQVRYTFAGIANCAEAGVANVEAQLIDDATDLVVDGQNVACVAGRFDFANVPAGTYRLHLDAIDGNNQVQYTADVDSLAFDTARKDLGVVDLDALASEVVVRFTLPAGETCASMGVANIDIRIVDAAGGSTGQGVACVAGEVTLPGPAPGNATIFAEGVAGDTVVLTGTRAATLLPGRTTAPQVVTLTPTRSVLELSWDFSLFEDQNVLLDDGEVPELTTSCVDADVDTVLVRIERGNGINAVLLESVETACNAGRVEVPNLVIEGGPVNVIFEGLRQQEGDSIFRAVVSNVALTGVRSSTSATLLPSIVFARVLWTGDCGVAGANTVDIQVSANGVSEGINIACAIGNTTIALPRGTEGSLVTIALRGVDGQGTPSVRRQTIDSVSVQPGIATFRFTGPE